MNDMSLVDDPNLEKPGPVITLDVSGMHCAACVSSVEAVLQSHAGVVHARVSLPAQNATVQLVSEDVELASVAECVSASGYTATLSSGAVEAIRNLDSQYRAEAKRWLLRWISGAGSFAAIISLHLTDLVGDYFVLSACVLVVAIVGYPFFKRAIRLGLKGRCSMDTLIALGAAAAVIGAAVAISQQGNASVALDGALMVSIIAFGNWLESISRRASVSDMVSLGELVPETALLVTKDGTQKVSGSVLKSGDEVLLAPGDRVPCDATIIAGQSAVDQKWFTGESRPNELTVGQTILAGSSVLDGNLQVRITESQEDSSMSRVLSLVDMAAGASPPIQRFADKVVSVFVPVVLLISVASFALWSVSAPEMGLKCAIAVLVVACPCALGLATPIAMLVSSSAAAKRGILLQEPSALERLCQCDAMVFDKTGTLTIGEMQVVDVAVAAGVDEAELVAIAAGLEVGSKHPIGRAIVKYAKQHGIEALKVDTLRLLTGMGVSGFTRSGTVAIGNGRMLESLNVKSNDLARDDEVRAVVYVVSEGELKGHFVLQDEIREESRHVVERLKALGLEVLIATGDRQRVANDVAEKLGIKTVYADLTPVDKHKLVEDMAGQGRAVIMVGDGVNDSAAIAAATVGIAVADGVELAQYSADMVLTRDGLGIINDAIQTSARTMRIIKQNLWWAFAYNVTLIPMAAGLLTLVNGPTMSPFWAAIAMAMSSVSVVLNSLRLRADVYPGVEGNE